ncbi:MAG: glycosyltransferase [Cyclobacteriaceae bacterium]|nr:glycosyltransferase [Cyclobacteriaceae bacterium]
MSLLSYRFASYTQQKLVSQLGRGLDYFAQACTKDIGQKRLGRSAPRALVIYVGSAIPYFVAGDVTACPIIDTHAMYWEAAEMVRVLNQEGYVVDFVDRFRKQPKIEWGKYQLVIDEGNNLIEAPSVPDQKRVFYCTGLHWEFHNQSQLDRVRSFFDRTNVLVPVHRWLSPMFNDHLADYIFYWANPTWMKMFHPRPERHEITTSVVYVPEELVLTEGNRSLVWMGSSGAVHKGLDLVVEAVSQLPNVKLHIFGYIESEVQFFEWLRIKMNRYPNIIFEGPADVKSARFRHLASTSIAHVYPSCSEGGPGSVAQTSQFGLIPIVTATANARTGKAGYEITASNPSQIIVQLKESIENLVGLSEGEIISMRERVMDLARQEHSRAAYSRHFTRFIQHLK